VSSQWVVAPSLSWSLPAAILWPHKPRNGGTRTAFVERKFGRAASQLIGFAL
jgi:hypothetical protein